MIQSDVGIEAASEIKKIISTKNNQALNKIDYNGYNSNFKNVKSGVIEEGELYHFFVYFCLCVFMFSFVFFLFVVFYWESKAGRTKKE